jgi:hypothetical protein
MHQIGLAVGLNQAFDTAFIVQPMSAVRADDSGSGIDRFIIVTGSDRHSNTS